MPNQQAQTDAAPMSSAPAFRAGTIAYRHTETPFVSAEVALEDAALELGQRVAAEARRHAAAHRAVDDYVITSTILSQFLADDSPAAESFHHGIASGYGRAPDWITNSYECTGWGFILRHIQQKARLTGPRRLLLQIVDADIHNFRHWLDTRRWGKSGFGICTLLIEVAAAPGDSLVVASAPPAHALLQMGRALREFSAPLPDLPIAVPFFPAMSRRALFKCFDSSRAHPDHYPRFGHAFGSDPWLSLLAELGSGAAAPGDDCIIASLALNGYFAIARLTLAPALRYSLEEAA